MQSFVSEGRSDGRTVFVGDLSTICTENDLYEEFTKFGKVENIHIQRKGYFSMGYGFVTMSSVDESVAAALGLDGYLLLGRRLKVRDARRGMSASEDLQKYSIYFKFASLVSGKTSDEVKMRNIFLRYGDVLDISIRKRSFDPSTGLQNGFGFLKFATESAAYKLVSELQRFVVDDIVYSVELSVGNVKPATSEQRMREREGYGNGNRGYGMQYDGGYRAPRPYGNPAHAPVSREGYMRFPNGLNREVRPYSNGIEQRQSPAYENSIDSSESSVFSATEVSPVIEAMSKANLASENRFDDNLNILDLKEKSANVNLMKDYVSNRTVFTVPMVVRPEDSDILKCFENYKYEL